MFSKRMYIVKSVESEPQALKMNQGVLVDFDEEDGKFTISKVDSELIGFRHLVGK